MLRIVRELLDPVAQLRRMHTQVLRGLPIRHAAILDQPNSLKLELACKLRLSMTTSGSIKTPNSVSSEPGAGQLDAATLKEMLGKNF